MKLPSRSEIEDLAARLPRPRVIYDIAGTSPYLSRYYLHGRPTMPDGSEPFDERGDPHPEATWEKTFGVYLHRFHRGDADREVHCHPWEWSFSVILVGGYFEERRCDVIDWEGRQAHYTVDRHVRPGEVNFIAKDDFHRVELVDGECWTLFVAGPKVDTWGFWSKTMGYLDWRAFVDQKRGVVSATTGRVRP